MVILVLDSQSSVHFEFVPRGAVLNHEFYVILLRRQQEQCERNDRNFDRKHSCFCHHDNASARVMLSIPKFRKAKLRWFHSQPPYSPDLSPADFPVPEI